MLTRSVQQLQPVVEVTDEGPAPVPAASGNGFGLGIVASSPTGPAQRRLRRREHRVG